MRIKGLGPSTTIEKQIILLKLTDLMENRPSFGASLITDPDSDQRQWIARLSGVFQRLDLNDWSRFNAALGTLPQYWVQSIDSLQNHTYSVIEALKIDLEIDGRDEIGNAYKSGETYRFFRDLKEILGSASSEIMVVDPYFSGDAFSDYLSDIVPSVNLRLLLMKSPSSVIPYARKHVEQFGSKIEIRSSKKIHDRVIFLDRDDCWIMGGSIKDGGKAATYLLPLAPSLVSEKLQTYEEIWASSTQQSLTQILT